MTLTSFALCFDVINKGNVPSPSFLVDGGGRSEREHGRVNLHRYKVTSLQVASVRRCSLAVQPTTNGWVRTSHGLSQLFTKTAKHSLEMLDELRAHCNRPMKMITPMNKAGVNLIPPAYSFRGAGSYSRLLSCRDGCFVAFVNYLK